MNTLKSIAVAGMVLFTAFGTFAQDKKAKSPEERAERMTQKMNEELQLDAAKQAELKEANLHYAQATDAIKSDAGLQEEARKAKMKDARANYRAELETILTADQLAVLDAKREEMREKREEKANMTVEERAKMHTEHIHATVGLTEDQYAKVSELNLGVETKLEAIRTDVSMSPERKKEFIRGNRKDQMNVLQSILTPEQFEKLKEARRAEHHEDDHE